MKGLARRTREGISWTIAGSVASNLLRLAVFAILGRTLSKTDFGEVAAAMTVIQLGNTVKDLGLGLALVQRRDLERGHVEAAFTFSLGLGLALAVAIYFGAEPICEFYDMPHSIAIVQLLSLLFALRGIALVPGFMCRRNMSFRAITVADLSGYVCGSLVSVTLAVAGAGKWALAWGYVVETTVNVTLLVIASPPPFALRLRWRHLRELFGFGVGQSLAGVANYFANQGDYMVVGHFLGTAQLGIYQRAYELMRFPASVFSNVAGSVLFSAFAKVQDDPERLGRAFRRAMFASATVLLPASAGLIVLAPELVRILLGPHWGGVVWPFRVMALTMLFRTTYKLGAIVGRSSGAVFLIAAWHALYALLVIGGAMISKTWGILGVSCTTSLAIAVTFCGLSSVGLRVSSLRARELLVAHGPGMACAVAVGAISWLVASATRIAGLSFAIVAATATVIGAGVFVALAAWSIRRSAGEWPWLWDTARQFANRRRRPADTAQR